MPGRWLPCPVNRTAVRPSAVSCRTVRAPSRPSARAARAARSPSRSGATTAALRSSAVRVVARENATSAGAASGWCARWSVSRAASARSASGVRPERTNGSGVPHGDGAPGDGGDAGLAAVLLVGRLLHGRLLDDDVRVGAADAEGGDARAARAVRLGPGGGLRQQLDRACGPVDVRGRLADVQGRGQHAVAHREHHLDDAAWRPPRPACGRCWT